MFTSIFRKQLMASLGVLLVGFILLALVLNAVLQDFLVEQKESLLFRQGDHLVELLLEELRAPALNQRSSYEREEAELKRSLNIRSDLLLSEERTNANQWRKSAKRLLKQNEINDTSLLIQVMKGSRIVHTGAFKDTDEQVLLTVGIPIEEAGKVIGALFLHTPVQEIQTDKVTRIILLTAFLVALPSSLLIYYMSRRMTLPLIHMNKAAKLVGEGDFRVRITVKSEDEVGQLASTFNRMAIQLESLERMRKDLIANVSHELRTPLTSVRGFVQGLLEGVIPPEQQPRYLQMIYQELHRLTTLLNTMLDLSSIESGHVSIHIKTIRWSSLVHTVSDSMELRMEEKGIKFDIIEPDDVVLKVQGDPDRLKQILFNLLDNAIRHTHAGGSITIRSWNENNRLLVQVADTGSGIEPAKLPFIWERFFTEDASRHTRQERSGLGLTITKQLVELMNGTIDAQSIPGEGTTFSLSFPLPSAG